MVAAQWGLNIMSLSICFRWDCMMIDGARINGHRVVAAERVTVFYMLSMGCSEV